MPVAGNNICNPLSRPVEHIISHIERFGGAYPLLGNTQYLFIFDQNKSIDVLAQFSNPSVSNLGFHLALKIERPCNDADGEDAHIPRNRGNNRCCTGSGTFAHACGNKDKISAPELSRNDFTIIISRLTPLGRIGSRAKPVGGFLPDLHPERCFRVQESLTVSIEDDIFNAAYFPVDHVIDSIAAATTDTNNPYSNPFTLVTVKQPWIKLKCHMVSSPQLKGLVIYRIIDYPRISSSGPQFSFRRDSAPAPPVPQRSVPEYQA